MRRRWYLLSVAILGVVALIVAPVAYASHPAQVDNPGANPGPWLPSNANSYPNTSCDTIDPVLTIDETRVAYKCIGFPDNPATPANEAEMGVANLTQAVFETSSTGFPGTSTAGIPAIHMSWTTSGPVPTPGADTLFEGVNGFTFAFNFQNYKKQNSRQIIGNTIDCQRYAHMGPYLTGNGEFITMHYELVFEEGVWLENMIWGHTDPVGYSVWAFVADPSGYARGCNGTTPVPAPTTGPHNDPGSKVQSVVDQPNKTVHLYVPQEFHWRDNQQVPLTYDFMDAGDSLTGLSANAYAVVDTATTPAINVGPVQQSQSGVSNLFLLDWIPWAGYDLGTLSPQTRGVYGPTCAGYDAMEYTPGGAKNFTGGSYAPLAKGPQGQDRDTQVNPLYGAPNGLNHYDSAAPLLGGNTTNDIKPQDHGGPTICDIIIPTAAWWVDTGVTHTA